MTLSRPVQASLRRGIGLVIGIEGRDDITPIIAIFSMDGRIEHRTSVLQQMIALAIIITRISIDGRRTNGLCDIRIGDGIGAMANRDIGAATLARGLMLSRKRNLRAASRHE